MKKQVQCVTCEFLSLFEDQWICTEGGDDLWIDAYEDIHAWHDNCPLIWEGVYRERLLEWS